MLTLVLLFAAAAGTGTPVVGRPVPKAVGACSAVTAVDVERALGRRFAPGQEEVRGADSTCDYAAGSGQVSITLQHLRGPVDLALEIASLKKSIEDSSVRMAPEFGGAAFYLDVAGAGTQLHVIREDRQYLMISVLGFGDAEHVSAAAARLARIALPRI